MSSDNEDADDAIFRGKRVLLLQAGSTPVELETVSALLTQHGAQLEVSATEQLSVIVTSLTAPKRILKHLASIRNRPPAVGFAWVRESVQAGACLPYDAYVVDGWERTGARVADEEEEQWLTSSSSSSLSSSSRSASDVDAADNPSPPRKRVARESNYAAPLWASSYGTTSTASVPIVASATVDTGESLRYRTSLHPAFLNTRYACQRRTPLSHFNTALVGQLERIAQHRRLFEPADSAKSDRPYARLLAALRAYPAEITCPEEVREMVGMGSKLYSRVCEFFHTGRIREAEDLLADEEFQVVSLFTRIFGVGPDTARSWYSQGMTTIADLRRCQDVVHMTDTQRRGLALFDDLQQSFTTAEAEDMIAAIRKVVRTIDRQIVVIPVGGYRRGKQLHGDLDVIVTHPEESRTGTLLDDVLAALQAAGHVHCVLLQTHAGHETVTAANSAEAAAPLVPSRRLGRGASRRSGQHHFDKLAKAIIAFCMPGGQENTTRIHQVDLIVAPRSQLATAVLGWTGSKHFEQSIRQWAKDHGFKLTSHALVGGGAAGWQSGRVEEEQGERAIFERLGLEYIEPPFRNAYIFFGAAGREGQ
ncbi:hypothetical protein RI367_002061 [Sorochytrium milnesiophthora]